MDRARMTPVFLSASPQRVSTRGRRTPPRLGAAGSTRSSRALAASEAGSSMVWCARLPHVGDPIPCRATADTLHAAVRLTGRGVPVGFPDHGDGSAESPIANRRLTARLGLMALDVAQPGLLVPGTGG